MARNMKHNRLFLMVIATMVIMLIICSGAMAETGSGSCGESITWMLDAEGTLTISGTGMMWNWTWGQSPWNESRAAVQTIVIGDGITHIGNAAFEGCSNLISVTIPDSVVSIGDYAFQGCSSLSEIIIPDRVMSIGDAVFNDCGSLINVMIPDHVVSIGESTFDWYTSISAHMETDGAKALGRAGYAFREPGSSYDLKYLYEDNELVGLEIRNVDKDVPQVLIPDEVTHIGDSAFSECSNLENVTIPENVIRIGEWGFNACGNLTEIIIPEGLASIGQFAFANCESLVHIAIPDGVASIDGYTFSGCSELTEVVIPDSVVHIGDHAFEDCAKLTEITLPIGLTDIGAAAFCGCVHLESIIIPNGVAQIEYSAFAGCSSLRSITIPNSMISIGDSAFYGCSSLKDISIPESVTQIDGRAFEKCENLKSVVIPSGVTTIDGYTFSECRKLENAVLPKGLVSIGEYAFNWCDSMKEIDIPENVRTIGAKAFSDCYALESFIFPDGITTIADSTFWYCDALRNVVIPESVSSIEAHAFECCPSLENVSILDGVTNLGDYAFYCSNPKFYANRDTAGAVTLSKAGDSFRIPGENYALKYLFKGDVQTGLELGGVDENITVFTIPAGVTAIGEWAFGSNRMKSLTIPESVTEMSNYAFQGCGQLEKILIPESVSVFGESLFSTSPVVYCYEFSNADAWATDQGYEVRYLDGEGEDGVRTVYVEGVDRMAAGTEYQLIPVVFPATTEAVIWTSDDESVATVDENGKLTAICPGTATITATIGTASDAFEVEVYQPTTGFELSETEIWLAAKQSIQLFMIHVEPENAETAVVWSSSDVSAAEVNETGLVTTKKVGTVIIYAEDNGISRSCLIHLCYPVKTISIDDTEREIIEGDMLQLIATVVTTRDEIFENKLITFTSSDENILTVDRNGLVTAVYPGVAEVTATADNGVTTTIRLTVKCREHQIETNPAVSPTWEESGRTEGRYCTRCGEVFAVQREIPALNTLNVMKLPAGVTEIEEEAFAGLACQAVILPERCSSIGSRAFAGCEQLIYVQIPASLEDIAEDAFEGCQDIMVDRMEMGE